MEEVGFMTYSTASHQGAIVFSVFTFGSCHVLHFYT